MQKRSLKKKPLNPYSTGRLKLTAWLKDFGKMMLREIIKVFRMGLPFTV
jgi:hypothetical protein